MVAIVMFLQRAESNFSFFLFLPILSLYSERKMSSDESCSSYSTLEVHVPSKSEFLEVLGEGNLGVMLKCQRTVTGQIVATKFAKSICKEAVKEVRYFCDFGVHRCKRSCIVKGAVSAKCKKAILFIESN